MAEFEVCVCGECVIECPLCGGDKTIEVQVEDMDTTAEIDPPDTDWRD